MLVILFISVFKYTYFCFNSVFFFSIYHIHSFDHIEKLIYKFLAPLPGIGAVHFLSLEVDHLKNG